MHGRVSGGHPMADRPQITFIFMTLFHKGHLTNIFSKRWWSFTAAGTENFCIVKNEPGKLSFPHRPLQIRICYNPTSLQKYIHFSIYPPMLHIVQSVNRMLQSCKSLDTSLTLTLPVMQHVSMQL